MSMNQNWVETMVELYSKGYSDVEVCTSLGVSKKQFSHYINTSPAFAEIVEYGHDLAEAWAYKKNREFVESKDATANNVKALEKRMENMHGWSSKVESKNANLNLEGDVAKLKEELNSLLPEMAKLAGRTDVVTHLSREPLLLEVSNDEE